MGLGLHPVRHTSRKIPARRLTCGIARSRFNTCPDSTLPGGRRLDIVMPMFRISPGAVGSLLRAEITDFLNTTPARRVQRRERRTWRRRKERAGGGPGSVWFPDLRRSEAKLSFGVMVKF